MERDETSAWYAFFAREGEKMVRYARRRAQKISEMDAEDIVADVMLRLVSRLDTRSPVDNLAAYAYRSIRNRIVDYERTRSKTVRLEDFLDAEGELPLISMLMADLEKPFACEDRAALINRLTTAIDRLEPRQRAIVLATELQGESFRALSEKWNEPIGTLLSRKSRALRNLRRMLEESGDPNDFFDGGDSL